MRPAHFYIYSDACPTDWLETGRDTRWHTIVNFIFQSDPALQSRIDENRPAHEVLESDVRFAKFIANLQSKLHPNQLRKWTTGPSYRNKFCNALISTFPEHDLIVNAYSFQEQTLRASESALLAKYNLLVGGIEGRGIGFEKSKDSKNRVHMKHSFVDFYGYHEIEGLENQILPLMLICILVADQYNFYRQDLLLQRELGFDDLKFTVVSDKLSGDNDSIQKMQQNLRYLVDPEGQRNPIILTRSPKSDSYAGDLIVDNLAGWLNAAISDPSSEFAVKAKYLVSTGNRVSWKELLPSAIQLTARSARLRLNSQVT